MYQQKSLFLKSVRPILSEYRSSLRYQRLSLTKSGDFLKKLKKTQSIFIHIPKTGGKSIITSIYQVGIHNSFGHAPAIFYQSVFGTRLFDRFFKFAVVRNPYDRIYSAFMFMKKGGFNLDADCQLHAELCSLSFESFVKDWIPRQDLEKYIVFRPQSQFICDLEDRVLIDKVCYFENIQKEYAEVQSRLGIGENLSHLNFSQKSRSYLDVYDEEMKQIIKKLYHKDLQLFGYNFSERASETEFR